MLGKHTIKTWSTTQSSVSLSSGEAEFNGVVRGAGMGLGFQSLMRDLGQDAPVRVWTDSEAAIGISSRQGLGKFRHLDTHTLWIQHAVRSGRIDLRKVLGEANPADLFTKHSLSRERLQMLTGMSDCKFQGGRPDAAPQLCSAPSTKVTMANTCSAELVSEQRCHTSNIPRRSWIGFTQSSLRQRQWMKVTRKQKSESHCWTRALDWPRIP